MEVDQGCGGFEEEGRGGFHGSRKCTISYKNEIGYLVMFDMRPQNGDPIGMLRFLALLDMGTLHHDWRELVEAGFEEAEQCGDLCALVHRLMSFSGVGKLDGFKVRGTDGV